MINCSHFAVSKIYERHNLLHDTIGTKLQEDESFGNAKSLLFSVLGCVVGFSILEWIFYYLYSNMVYVF